MRLRFLTLVLFSTLPAAVLAQAPTVADPNSLTKKPATKTDKTPALVMRAKKTSASREIPDTYKGRVLTVGSGGGVTGKEKSYSLLDDGRLFSRKAGQKTYTFVGKQTAANTKKVFWSVEDRCAIRKTTYNKPGNIYRFVSWRKGTELRKVAWAPGDKQLPANYEQVYTGFIGMIPPAYQ
ncbi:FAD-binding oxidoreductase [Fibrella aquatica]|uniref:FAD-binding oxidoreductase n=1 Tax=Fibrella aquatica TaxID=3242487 RepID=UPI003523096D